MHDVMGGNAPAALVDALQRSLALEQWARRNGNNVDCAVQAFLRVLRHARLRNSLRTGCLACDVTIQAC
jgi:hypothetical protein